MKAIGAPHTANLDYSHVFLKSLVVLVTITALAAIATGAMGFEGMKPFAEFYGHAGTIKAMAGGAAALFLEVVLFIYCKKKTSNESRQSSQAMQQPSQRPTADPQGNIARQAIEDQESLLASGARITTNANGGASVTMELSFDD